MSKARKSKDRKSTVGIQHPAETLDSKCTGTESRTNIGNNALTPIRSRTGRSEGPESTTTLTVARQKGNGYVDSINTEDEESMATWQLKARDIARHNIESDDDSLFDLVAPKRAGKGSANAIIKRTMATINEGFSALAGKTIAATVSKEELKEHNESFDLERAIESTFRLSQLNEASFQDVREADMYPLFKDFVMLVAHHVNPPHDETHVATTSGSAKRKRARSDSKPDPVKPGVVAKKRRVEAANKSNPGKLSDKARGKRAEHVSDSDRWQPSLILPYGSCDVKPEGSDSKTRVDLALAVCIPSTPVNPLANPKYKDIFAIAELKRSSGEQVKADEQLVEYTRGIYANQIHRRYAWGLTMCGTNVRCYLFHHDGIKATSMFDFSTTAGIEKFVTLLVHWSCCGSARLGYDTTITRDKANGRWNISCPNLEGDQTLTYYTTGMILNTTSLFGRHTRCYLAKLKDDDSDKEYVIKDAWSLPRDLKENNNNNNNNKFVPPDEVYNLREITEKLKDNEEDLMYPQVVSGGVVEIFDGRSCVKDDTSLIYGFKNSDKQQLFREHRRIVMTPVGHYIKSVKDECELILVLDDATKCHNAIYTECGLLHRDISVNNILVIRNDDPKDPEVPEVPKARPVRGLLIDFDHAIKVDQTSTGNSTRSGTLPYMSIHNLEGAKGKRTRLDDWESILYVICWLATFGINDDDRKNTKEDMADEIKKWRTGTMEEIAKCKRKHMNSLESFEENILVGFQDKYKMLKALAPLIYEALFQREGCVKGTSLERRQRPLNPLKSAHIEAMAMFQSGQSPEPEPKRDDPLVSRLKHEEDIVKDLLGIMKEASAYSEKTLIAKNGPCNEQAQDQEQS